MNENIRTQRFLLICARTIAISAWVSACNQQATQNIASSQLQTNDCPTYEVVSSLQEAKVPERPRNLLEVENSLLADGVEIATDYNFLEKVVEISNKKIVMVNFWAEWCGPCKQISPGLIAIANESDENVSVVYFNIDEDPQIPRQYGIRGIPTVLIFEDEQIARTLVGAAPKKQYLEVLRELQN